MKKLRFLQTPRTLFPSNRPKLKIVSDLGEFAVFIKRYIKTRGYFWFDRFEKFKDYIVDILYKRRGRYTRPFMHFATVGLTFLAITLGPILFSKPNENQFAQATGPVLLTATAYAPDFYTNQAEGVRQYRGGEIITHIVGDGETVSSIADRYGLRTETILWENNLSEAQAAAIKPGKELKILPVDGVLHKVARGETVYSIGKKYGLDGSQVQSIVDYPFNEFLSDETFDLVIGQTLVIPDGVMPSAKITSPAISRVALTPDAGSVSAIGSFIWPASGRITQSYRSYHPAIDIANHAGGSILASDAGVVTVAGWLDGYGYGNRVAIDHGNGYTTLYAHLSLIQVRVGQRVNRGDVIGQMGNTGRSTGTHLHFEIRHGGTLLDPSVVLR